MAVFSPAERRFLHAASQLAHSNPFLPERVEWEQAALGRDFVPGEPVWSASVADPDATRLNVHRIQDKLEPLLVNLTARLTQASDITTDDLALYEDCVHYWLYTRYYPEFAAGDTRFYERFLADWRRALEIPGKRFETALEPAHLFACFGQVQRAFHLVFGSIIGASLPAARLRASVWQSIFTHDMRRYRRTLWRRMGDFPTLITGPSGTGKELVARAIAGARYLPFDVARRRLTEPAGETFFAIHIAALSATLIESELFGHRRGAFTGAVGDRKGWLDVCPPLGSVFLDELGEMELSIQVKLLRVLETRRFAAVGDTALREFHGKIVAATNRDLPAEIRAGRFREDLYYRLCADLIQTPSLAEQLRDSPEALRDLLLYMVRRAVGDEAERCLPEVESWVATHLPRDYAWPGNYRELEQCVRNIVIRRSYRPMEPASPSTEDDFTADLRAGRLTADELLARYAALVYRQAGSYEEAARRLGLDRRTVKAKVEAYLAHTAG